MPTGDGHFDMEPTEHLSVGRLTLNDFRCYAYLRLDTDGRPVVLTGPNGAGKTNLLEALSFLVPGRGLRGARLSEPTRRETAVTGPAAWAVAARLRRPQGPVSLGTGLAAGGEKRVVRIDGHPAKSQAVLAESMSALWLTPQMDGLFTGSGSARRRFVDRLVFGLDPAHATRVSAYERAMGERSRLLRRGAAGEPWDGAWIAVLEETMATQGIAIAAARREMAARLNNACAQATGPFPGACLEMGGDVETWLEEGPALAAEDRLRRSLEASRPLDSRTGGAAQGPHRGDLLVGHREKGLSAAQCSTGEQKAVLVAIVLANARLQARHRGTVPLLLLDEVVAHLDERRRLALFEEIDAIGAQAWLSGTDAGLFAPLGHGAQYFRVENAAVTPHGVPRREPTEI